MFATETSFRSSRPGADRNLVLLIYVLYLVGFLTGVTAVIGVVLAHLAYPSAYGLKREHLRRQIRMFWYGVLWLTAIGCLHLMVAGLGAITGGFGLVFMVVPWALTFAWTVMTLWEIARGMHAACLGRSLTPGSI